LPKKDLFEASAVCREVGPSELEETSAKAKSITVSDALECEQRQAQLKQLGWQTVDLASGVLSKAEKHDWANQVLQSDPEASRIHAAKILGLGASEAAEDAWWRGARVSRQDAAIVLIGLGIACANPAAAIAEWDGIGKQHDSCPSDQLWRS
jgi:hypothetical protein